MLALNRTAWALAIALLPALSSAQVTGKQEEKKMDAKQLVGTFTMVSGEKGGMPVPAEHLADSVARITDDRITVVDKDKKERYVAAYRLLAEEPSKLGGCKIAMKSVDGPGGGTGEDAIGLIKVEADVVTLIYTPDGIDPPTEYRTKPGSNQMMFVMKRQGDEPQLP
jgi:uncharacterized protein (TIGR03067 family)